MANGVSRKGSKFLPVYIFGVGITWLWVSGCDRQQTRASLINEGATSRLEACRPLTAVSSHAARTVVNRPDDIPQGDARLAGVDAGKNTGNPAGREAGADSASARSAWAESSAAPTPLRGVGSGRTIARVEVLPIPLAAVGFNPSLKLNAQQIQQVAKLAQEFLAATDDGAVQAPGQGAAAAPVQATGLGDAAPVTAQAKAAFDARWLSAQQKSDAEFKMFFGYQAFNAQMILRGQQECLSQQHAQQ